MSDPESGPTKPSGPSRGSPRSTLNEAFNQFLGISESDQEILKRHQQALGTGSEEFAEIFYAYLDAYPATAEILKAYQQRGGSIDTLVRNQLQHFLNFLTGDISEQSAARLDRIGAQHFRHQIQPMWVMGAYLMYWDHLHNIVREHPRIAPAERTLLDDTISRLLFRDMGLMLEGYWHALRRPLEIEHPPVSDKPVQIDGLKQNPPDDHPAHEPPHEPATIDPLTGLHSRALMCDRLGQAIAWAKRRSTRRTVALLVMDLDHFKEINDTLGHTVGDAVLCAVAERLKQTLRETDTLARLGGDEFAVLLPDVEGGREAVEKAARELLDSFARPFQHAGHEFYLGAGIGIALYPDHGEEVDTLMSRADVAMYGAKHKDVPYVFYDASSDPHTPQRLQLGAELRRALDNGELVLHYQPQIDMPQRCVTGVEALLRWNHPVHGELAPDRFLAMAERTGLINPISDWVLAEAMRQCQRWRMVGLPLRMSVNLASRNFMQGDLVQKIERLMRASGIDSRFLEVEITENTLLADIDSAIGILQSMHDMGVTVSIDDYGTGYSSLAYLKKLPLHTLKIDKSFVRDMAHDENDAVIVRSTIDLAHNLGYRVVAEGVEDKEAYELLEILGCDSVQGFHVSEPLAARGLEFWLSHSDWTVGCHD